MIADAADGRVRVTELESGNLLGYGLCVKWLLGSELFVPIFQSLKVMTKDTNSFVCCSFSHCYWLTEDPKEVGLPL